MMFTYLILNIIFIALIVLLLHVYAPKMLRAWYTTLVVLLVMTAIFDNVIISLGIVAYNPSSILGLYIYKAPVEDFFYAVLAVYAVPALWNYFEHQKTKEKRP